jgi:hypothetical protein
MERSCWNMAAFNPKAAVDDAVQDAERFRVQALFSA